MNEYKDRADKGLRRLLVFSFVHLFVHLLILSIGRTFLCSSIYLLVYSIHSQLCIIEFSGRILTLIQFARPP